MSRGFQKAMKLCHHMMFDFDSGLAGGSDRFFTWVTVGDESSPTGTAARMWSCRARLAHIDARLASGSRSLTFVVNINGSTAAEVTETIDTTMQTLIMPRHFIEVEDVISVGFEGATIAVDRIIARAVFHAL